MRLEMTFYQNLTDWIRVLVWTLNTTLLL